MDLYKFVSFVFILLVVSEAKQQRFIADFSASQKLHHSTLLMLVFVFTWIHIHQDEMTWYV